MTEFSKIVIPKLNILRKKVNLSQAEVAHRMKLKTKSGQSFVARLEKSKIKRPAFDTILNYLDAIGVNWGKFFTELSNERDKLEHKEIMSKATQGVILSHSSGMTKNLVNKLDRDTRLYETKIKPPINYYTKVDMELVKKKVNAKVKEYLQTLNIKPNLVPHYLSFAHSILNTSKYEPVIDEYNISGISKTFLTRIINIVNKIGHAEQTKVEKQKPLRSEKARDMAVKYLQSRVKLAPVENTVKNLLVENNLTNHVLFNAYMNFGRECYRVYKKYYQKDQSLMKQELAGLTKAWAQGGLDKEMMEKIKQAIIKYYEPKDKPTQ